MMMYFLAKNTFMAEKQNRLIMSIRFCKLHKKKVLINLLIKLKRKNMQVTKSYFGKFNINFNSEPLAKAFSRNYILPERVT